METTKITPRPGGSGEHGLRPYRPALDGIRAVAVFAVVAYHLGLPAARGGFLGVDIFFVLSGYLITSLLLLEHDATGRIDLWRFWMRRAKRLLPALLVVLVVVATWVHLTVPDFQMGQRRLDLQWALFYGSNWHLISSAQDYFAQGSGVSLVRHTWSLAIEEQFYFVWPLVVAAGLWLARARTRVLVTVCVIGTIGSIVCMAALHSAENPSRAYYGTDARAHQLLLGALLAVAMLRSRAAGGSRRSGAVVAGLSLAVLLAAFVTMGDGGTVYYLGGSALISVATAGLIWGLQVAPDGVLARTLGAAPVRWIGLISYGIYLWHWPVILMIGAPAAVFAWLPGSIGLNVTRVTITLACAGLSYVAVERPIRRGGVQVAFRTLPRFGVATVGTLVTAAMVIAVLTRGSALQAEAFVHGGAVQIDKQGCVFDVCLRHRGSRDAPVVALIGDSIARSMDLGFVEEARRRDFTYLVAANDGCRVTQLLTSTTEQGFAQYEICRNETPMLWRELQRRWQPDLVVVVQQVERADFVDDTSATVEGGSKAWAEAERLALPRVIRPFTAAGSPVVLVEAQPVLTPERCLRVSALSDPDCSLPITADRKLGPLNDILTDVARTMADVTLVSVNRHLCPGGICPPAIGSMIPRYDGSHYTSAGARWVVPLLLREIRTAGAWPSRARTLRRERPDQEEPGLRSTFGK